jgi:TRAP-type C4-dicarboxylate transport system permease small subunit
MPLLRGFVRLADALAWGAAIVSALLTLSIVVMILCEIGARSLFNISLSFAWEYSAYAMGVAMFGGAAFALRTGGHIRVSLLAGRLPAAAAHWVDVLCTVIGIALAGFITAALAQLAWRSFIAGSTSPTMSETPLVVPQTAIAIGAALLTAQLLARLLRLLWHEPTEDDSMSFEVE